MSLNGEKEIFMAKKLKIFVALVIKIEEILLFTRHNLQIKQFLFLVFLSTCNGRLSQCGGEAPLTSLTRCKIVISYDLLMIQSEELIHINFILFN